MKLTMSCRMIAQHLNGELIGANAEVDGQLSTDSRSIASGDVFIALQGDRFDGHNYLLDVAARGAALAVVSSANNNLAIPQVVVADTLVAYGQLAGVLREQFSGVVFGITGSSGKTSCKEMLVAILAVAGRVHATLANNNNEVGVPLTLSQIEADDDFAVIEMGAGKPDDIAYLVGFAQPDIAMVTNVGEAHLELFGSVENIAATKKQIYNATSKLRAAAVFGDDPVTAGWREELTLRGLHVCRFGLNPSNDVFPIDVITTINGSTFTLCTPEGEISVHLAVPGMHMVKNACAAAAMALLAGVHLARIAEGLSQYKSIKGRLAVRQLGRVSVFDDSYNANPRSMRAAIETLSLAEGRRVLVLGDMAELGKDTVQLHEDIGRFAKGKVDVWYSTGPLMARAANAFGSQAVHCEDIEQLNQHLCSHLQPNDTVLVKGSRSSRMERVIAALEKYFEGSAH